MRKVCFDFRSNQQMIELSSWDKEIHIEMGCLVLLEDELRHFGSKSSDEDHRYSHLINNDVIRNRSSHVQNIKGYQKGVVRTENK